MNLSVTTIANNGHLDLYIIDGGTTVLQISNTDSGSVQLSPGIRYRFEWHVWSSIAADYTIQASVIPATDGFAPFNPPVYQYPGAHRDMGGFYFTL